MRKIFKKLTALACALLLFGNLCSCLSSITTRAEASAGTPIDMYLIAGQSNAAGYSTKGFSSLNETFENVGYGGEVQRYFRDASKPSSSCYLEYEDFVWGVRSGLGSSAGYVGPEYGIAKAINEQYASMPDGRKAFIFKTAAGGTSLRNIDNEIGTTEGNYGNWYPRSLWQDGYKPNTATNTPENSATGYLYQLFVENFEKVYNELKENGYDPVVKGFAWMQGCQDLSYPTQYESLLKTFIQDMREDIAQITSDHNAYSMPFVIGKIATTFGSHNNPLVPVFNQVQEKVAEKIGGSATVETSDLVIVNADGTYNGTDKYHFNCGDAEILGVRFGEKLLELNGKKIASVGKVENGKISYSFTQEGQLLITAIPQTGDKTGDKKYRLNKLFVNQEEVTEGVVNNTYTVAAPANRTFITAEFVELNKYSVVYSMDKKLVGLVAGNAQVYETESFTFELDTKDGYTITKVTANGTELSANEGVYTVENVLSNVEIKVETAKIGGEQAPEETAPKEENGCAGSVLGGSLSCGVALLASLLIVQKKRKEN